MADEADQITAVVTDVAALLVLVAAILLVEVEAGADDDGVLAGQGEVDQVQQGGVDGADEGQGVPAIGISPGTGESEEVIRGIGHEVLQQS